MSSNEKAPTRRVSVRYPVPGRGAWRTTGGLLTAKPGSASKIGYYRLASAVESPVGSTWLRANDITHHAHVVQLGVVAIQGLVGADPDGWFGPQTDTRIRTAQRRLGLAADGFVGPTTMHALLEELVASTAGELSIPVGVLGGILAHESALDPAAVGVNGLDHGLAQINLGAHAASVSLEQTLTPSFAIGWTAQELAHTYAVWAGKTRADPWDVAIANHNSPLLARKWAQTGQAPFVEGRVFQISEYVSAVREAW